MVRRITFKITNAAHIHFKLFRHGEQTLRTDIVLFGCPLHQLLWNRIGLIERNCCGSYGTFCLVERANRDRLQASLIAEENLTRQWQKNHRRVLYSDRRIYWLFHRRISIFLIVVKKWISDWCQDIWIDFHSRPHTFSNQTKDSSLRLSSLAITDLLKMKDAHAKHYKYRTVSHSQRITLTQSSNPRISLMDFKLMDVNEFLDLILFLGHCIFLH